jgi:ATP-dependent Lhr-like helicase
MDEGIAAWFAQRGWRPFAFQQDVWGAIAAGRSGPLHASTGAGKMLAVWFGALARHRLDDRMARGLAVLWITPMHALAHDTAHTLSITAAELESKLSVGIRTGDTATSERARQDRSLPGALVTTPESLSLLLLRDEARQQLAGVELVVVNEWHELLGNKRGVQTQLAIARLRGWNSKLIDRHCGPAAG